MLTGRLADPKRVLLLQNKMDENLNLLENVWLKDKPFLCGDKISISDLVAACEIEQPSKRENNFYKKKNISYLLIFVYI